MLTSIAAVPASTSCSPQLSVTIYSPNQSTRRQIFRLLANNGLQVRTSGMSILLGAGPPD